MPRNILLKRPYIRIILFLGITSPAWLFFFNFSRYVAAHKASLPVEVLAITEKGTELSNLCRISPSGKIDSFNVIKRNYFSREDEWGQGKGYIKTIAFKAQEQRKIKFLVMRCGDRIYSWDAGQIRSDWKNDGANCILEKAPSAQMPFFGAVMNYAGNASVARAVFFPSLLMSVIVLALSFLLYLLNKNFRIDLSISQNIHSGLFQARAGKLFTWTTILSIVAFYLYNYFTLPPYVHAETYLTFPQLANGESEGFWDHLAKKSFDLGRFEEGGYRPRALAFIIGYTDTNLMIWLNDHFHGFGPRLPFMLAAAFLLVFSVYRLTRTLLPTAPIELALLIGCSMLFFQNFQATSYIYLRSAKALCPGVCVLLLDLYFRNMQKKEPVSSLRSVIYGFILFLACTLDEQVIAVVVLILVLSIISRQKTKLTLYASSFALLLYALFHFTAASWLFGPLTPQGIHKHDHSFTDPFFAFGLESVERAGEIWMHLALSLGASLLLLIPVVVITSAMWLKLSLNDKMLSGALFLFSFLLVGGVIGSHRTAYFCKELWNSAYFLPAACLMLAGLLFTWGKGITEMLMPRAAVLLTCFFLLSVLVNTSRVDVFYNNYTSVEARERGAIVDPHDWMRPEHVKYFDNARKPSLRLEAWLNKSTR